MGKTRVSDNSQNDGPCLNFCKNTSMKGIPRIFKSENTCIRVTWIVAVTILMCFTVTNVVTLVANYIKYEVVTNFWGEYLNSEDMWINYPSITLCNLNPLNSNSSSFVSSKNLMKLSEYYDEVENYLNGKRLDDEELKAVKSNMMTYRAYKEYLGHQNGVKASHNVENFIIKCTLLGTDTVHTHRLDCSNIADIERIVSPDFFNCYTFKTNRNKSDAYRHINRRLFIEGLSIVVYLDSLYNESPHQFSSSADTTQAAGIRVFIHQPDTIPQFSKGFDVAAGFSTTLFQRLIKTQKLPPPYGDCKPAQDLTTLTGPSGQKITAR